MAKVAPRPRWAGSRLSVVARPPTHLRVDTDLPVPELRTARPPRVPGFEENRRPVTLNFGQPMWRSSERAGADRTVDVAVCGPAGQGGSRGRPG